MATVTVLDLIDPAGVEQLAQHHDVVLLWETGGEIPAETTIVVTRTTPVGAPELSNLPNVRLVVKHGVGVDNIDIPECSERGILVANTPAVGAQAVAEHAVALISACAKDLRQLDQGLRAGDFAARDHVRTVELRGKAAGIIGLGNIGRRTAAILSGGYGMSVLGYDPFLDSSVELDGVTRVETLEELIGGADAISLHVPLTPQTYHLIDRRVLALARPGAIIVNTARGGLIDESALADALADGALRAAGIDVFEAEPPAADNPLGGVRNAVLTPHIAGLTADTGVHLALAVADTVAAFTAGHPLTGLLNPTVKAAVL